MSEHSVNCSKCGEEIILELEYEAINVDPRDGFSQWGFTGGIVDKVYRTCQCEFTKDEEDKIIEDFTKDYIPDGR